MLVKKSKLNGNKKMKFKLKRQNLRGGATFCKLLITVIYTKKHAYTSNYFNRKKLYICGIIKNTWTPYSPPNHCR